MTTLVGIGHRVYLHQLDLSGLANHVDFGPMTVAMKDSTTFNDGGFYCQKPGLFTGGGRVQGYQDFAVDVLDDDVSIGQLGTQYAYTVVPSESGTIAAGDPAYIARGVISDLNPLKIAIGEMGQFDLGIGYDTAFGRAKVLAAKAAVVGDTTGTAVALTGPSSTQRLYAVLHVFAYSGFTNVVFTIQSDDAVGFPSSTTRLTFATITARTSEFASVAGGWNTETHLRVFADTTGAGSITYAVSAFVL